MSTAPASLSASVPPPDRALRVLIVDGHSVNQQLWAHMLRRLGHKSLAVSDGEEAIDSLKQIPFDVVLMDLDLPTADSFDIARRIRERVRNPERPWIIAASLLPESDDYDRAMAAGMNDFVIKSGHFENLMRAMRFAERSLAACAVAADRAA